MENAKTMLLEFAPVLLAFVAVVVILAVVVAMVICVQRCGLLWLEVLCVRIDKGLGG